MDSQVLGKFMCVLLCTVGVVVAEDGCATFGQVYNYNADCFTSIIHGNGTRFSTNLTTTCSTRNAVRKCMKDKTANCANKATVMAEVDNYFSLCDGTNVSALAQQYLPLPEERCDVNVTAGETCSVELEEASNGFPFLNKTFSNGLKAVKKLKQVYFKCYKIGLQSNGNCAEATWKITYVHSILTTMVRLYVFGIYIDEADKLDIAQLQNEIDVLQNPLNARDIFDWGLF